MRHITPFHIVTKMVHHQFLPVMTTTGCSIAYFFIGPISLLPSLYPYWVKPNSFLPPPSWTERLFFYWADLIFVFSLFLLGQAQLIFASSKLDRAQLKRSVWDVLDLKKNHGQRTQVSCITSPLSLSYDFICDNLFCI